MIDTYSKNGTVQPEDKSSSYKGTYKTTANLNLRVGPGSNKDIVFTIPSGKKIECDGYYTKNGNSTWLYVEYGKYEGYVHSKYVKKS